ncbi:cytochrome P450 [Streptomyces sp. NPDC052396]|uniref:cytochrome P450 n=1 Tax=Streptomyces sp. NPDC052396 TaxID=3365689 RepID=UPI0037D0BEF7
MTETVASPTSLTHPAPQWPQDRGCPYHPPTAYPRPDAQRPMTRVALWDGSLVWFVTGHAEARALLADPRLSSDRHRPEFPVVMARLADQRTVELPLLGVDDPEHNRQRRMLIPRFGLKQITAMRPRIQQIVDTLIDRMLAGEGRADLVPEFALPVPSMVICELLGVPYADHEFFESRSRVMLNADSLEEIRTAREDVKAYLQRLVDAKQAEPGQGLLDELIAERLAEGALDREELVMLAMILLIAGHETTANMISLGTFTLLQHPEQLAELRQRPEIVPGAVEELLRYLSIADGMVRVATEDLEVGGETIRAGEGVLIGTSVINRDPAAYQDPDRLDVHRSARHHVAFGYGIHQCLGQNLARVELEIALSTLFARIPTLRLAVAPDEVPAKPGGSIQGLFALPVTW